MKTEWKEYANQLNKTTKYDIIKGKNEWKVSDRKNSIYTEMLLEVFVR